MKLLKLTALSAALLSTSALADWSANVGLVSDYHFRGIQQTESASASAGIDYTDGGVYAGLWTAEVEDGLEVDLYGGYGHAFENGLELGIGFTSYQYTGDFDSEYNEVNLTGGFGMVSFEYSFGEWKGPVAGEGMGVDSDYSFYAVTLEKNGFYGTFGAWGNDFDGEYTEFGYGTSYEGFDLGVGLVFSGSDLDDSESLYFSIGKSFDL